MSSKKLQVHEMFFTMGMNYMCGLRVSFRYMRYKEQARDKLRSEEGYVLSVRRMIKPESVFG